MSGSISKPVFTLMLGSIVAGLVLVAVFAERSRNATQRQRRVTGNEIVVKPGDNLQAAIRSARPGDTLVLQAGATYRGPLILPYKSETGNTDADFITIRSSDLSGLSQAGERVKPEAQARSMAKIVSPSQQVAVGTEAKAHHYRFVGIEFSPAADADYVYNLVELGAPDYKSYSEFPHHLVFDRCYVHSTGLNKARRGFALNSAETSILNSHVSGFAGAGDETQAIAGWNGPGPFHIINNYLEGGGEIVLFGGADPSINGLVPADIEIRRNYFHRPAAWAGKATIKGSFELKNAKRVKFDANVIESEILVTAIVLTTRNQGGKAPWSILEDVAVTNNIVRRASTGINILGSDNEHPSQDAKNIRISNNLFTQIVPDDPSNIAYFLQTNGGQNITVAHNTIQQDGNVITTYGRPTQNFVFTDNIIQFNLYGVVCLTPGGQCPRENMFCACFPNGVFKGNVFADNRGAARRENIDQKYPPGNSFVSSYSEVGFAGYENGRWELRPNSRFRGRATDGRDPGVDFAAMRAAGVASAVSGAAFGN